MKRHFENLSKKAGRAVKHWWMLLLAGILCIAAGITVFVFPLESYVTLSIIFGILMVLVGAIQLIVASTSNNYLAMRGYVITGGVLDIILGFFLCLYPGVTLVLLPIMLGIWMLYHSFMIIAFAGDLSTFDLGGQGETIAGGIILLLLSILILMNPFSAGIAAVVVLTGVGFVVFGFILVMLSVKLKRLHLDVTSQDTLG
jgi:uncharacterized membrane protein HdeD (DUF308 family)